MIQAERTLTINIDTGGTFTDGIVSDGQRTHALKVLTTPHDLTVCFRNVLTAAASGMGLTPLEMLRRTASVRYSTTVGTNAVIERKGPRIGLLVSPEDVPALTALGKDSLLAHILDPPHAWIRGVDTAAGALSEQAVLGAVEELLAEGAERLVVCLSGPSFLATEAAIKEIILKEYPRHILGALPILFSSELTSDTFPARRAATAVLNAYLHPALEHFLYNAEDIVRDHKFAFPLFVFGNDGTSNRVAKVTALKTYNSGPSGGVEAAVFLARHYALPHLVSIDIGGTSTDCAFVRNGQPEVEAEGHIEDLEVSFPIRVIHALGAGGGTIAKVEDGRLLLGPESAGAAPGPACFGFGGQVPTATDANVVIGYFGSDRPLAGQVSLDPYRARNAVQKVIADPLGISVEEAGGRIRDALEDTVAVYLRAQLVEKGLDPAGVVLCAFGGAGPAYACGVADRLGVGRVMIPSLCSVFSAFGVGTSDVVHEYAASVASNTAEGFREATSSLLQRATVDMKGEGFSDDAVSFTWDVAVHKNGVQVFRASPDDIDDWPRLSASIQEAKSPNATTRVSLEATARLPHVTFSNGLEKTAAAPPVAPRKRRAVVWTQGRPTDTPVYSAEDVEGVALKILGPAIIESTDTTIVIPPRWVLTTDPQRQYILTKEVSQ